LEFQPLPLLSQAALIQLVESILNLLPIRSIVSSNLISEQESWSTDEGEEIENVRKLIKFFSLENAENSPTMQSN
jgi:hypothetical protein